jgi:hypothetical protein
VCGEWSQGNDRVGRRAAQVGRFDTPTLSLTEAVFDIGIPNHTNRICVVSDRPLDVNGAAVRSVPCDVERRAERADGSRRRRRTPRGPALIT